MALAYQGMNTDIAESIKVCNFLFMIQGFIVYRYKYKYLQQTFHFYFPFSFGLMIFGCKVILKELRWGYTLVK